MKIFNLVLVALILQFACGPADGEPVISRCVPLQLSDVEKRSNLVIEKRKNLVRELFDRHPDMTRFVWCEGTTSRDVPVFFLIGYAVDGRNTVISHKFSWGWVDEPRAVVNVLHSVLELSAVKTIVRATEDAARNASPLRAEERSEMDAGARRLPFGTSAYETRAIFEVAGRPDGNLAFTYPAYSKLSGPPYAMAGAVRTLDETFRALLRLIDVSQAHVSQVPLYAEDPEFANRLIRQFDTDFNSLSFAPGEQK